MTGNLPRILVSGEMPEIPLAQSAPPSVRPEVVPYHLVTHCQIRRVFCFATFTLRVSAVSRTARMQNQHGVHSSGRREVPLGTHLQKRLQENRAQTAQALLSHRGQSLKLLGNRVINHKFTVDFWRFGGASADAGNVWCASRQILRHSVPTPRKGDLASTR